MDSLFCDGGSRRSRRINEGRISRVAGPVYEFSRTFVASHRRAERAPGIKFNEALLESNYICRRSRAEREKSSTDY